MISSVSSQAGVVASRRKRINETAFNTFRHTKVQANLNPTFCVQSPPKALTSFVSRHIYNYNKTTNSFEFLGVQKAQRLKRTRNGEFTSEIVIAGFGDGIINGTYTRLNVNDQFLYKDNSHYINAGNPPSQYLEEWTLISYSQEIAYVYNGYLNIITENYEGDYDNTPPLAYTSVYEFATIDNTTVKKANQNKLYNNIDPDFDRDQLEPDVDFDINTCNIFDKKNLAHNQKVFLDIRWVKFVDEKRRGGEHYFDENSGESWWWKDETGGGIYKKKKGHIYRAGVLIIQDNLIDSMIHFTDLENEAFMWHGRGIISSI